MLRINIIYVSKNTKKYYKQLEEEYYKRISRFAKIKFIEISSDTKSSIDISKKKEAESIIKFMKLGYNISLDINGQMTSSEKFAEDIKNLPTRGESVINFIIGGSNGLDDSIKQYSQKLISFSPMTFPHQLFKVMLLEQIYRAFAIIKNTPYHK